MSRSFEGDIIRPLGLVTLNFAYAEVEIDKLLASLSAVDRSDSIKDQWSVGRKIAHVQKLIDGLDTSKLDQLKGHLNEAATLFDRRNALIHSAIYTGTRTVTSRLTGVEQRVSPDDLRELAKQIFSCKEQLNVARQRVLDPILAPLRASSRVSQRESGGRR